MEGGGEEVERARVTAAAAGGVEVGGRWDPCDRAAWKGECIAS